MAGEKDREKSKDELITDLSELRLCLASLEGAEGAIKQAELAVRAASEYAENIVETVREPLIVLDADLKVVSANQSFYDTFKVTPKESIGNLIYNLGNSQWDIPKLRTLLEDILPKDRKFANFEVDHVFSSIGHRIMLLNARRIHHEGTNRELVLLAIEDITERKQLENELKDSEERFRRVFETAKDGLLLIDKQTGNIVNVNPAIIKLLGYSRGELIGKKLQDVGVLKDIKDSKETFQEVIEYGFTNYDDVSVETKEGDFVDAEIYFVDRARFIQCNVRDITERKRAEEARQLIEYEKLSALGRLMANVAHEIRNPITIIGGLAKRIEKSIPSGTKGREDLELIFLEAKRLEELLRDVLYFSSKPFSDRVAHDINQMIDESLNVYQDAFAEHSISVNKCFGNAPKIYVDKSRVIVAIKNLISNAIEAMPGGGTLTITTDRGSVNGKNFVYTKITDTGVGISEDKIRMVFEPFFTTKVTKKEAWLGLPIAKRIVEGYGGFIRVDSSVEKGSTFSLYFPLRAT